MNRDGLCQLCFDEPGKHQFAGRTPALIGDRCLKRAQRIAADASARKSGAVIERRERKPRAADVGREGLVRRRMNGKWVYETAAERARRLAHRTATRKPRASRALPSRPCRHCGAVMIRVAKRGPMPERCDGCHKGQPRRHKVPVVRAGAVA